MKIESFIVGKTSRKHFPLRIPNDGLFSLGTEILTATALRYRVNCVDSQIVRRNDATKVADH